MATWEDVWGGRWSEYTAYAGSSVGDMNGLGPNQHLYLVNAICRQREKKIFALLKAAEAVAVINEMV